MVRKKSRLYMLTIFKIKGYSCWCKREQLRRKKQKKRRHQQNSIPYVPKDCVSNILNRLPLQSLQRSSCVCKSWYKIINNPKFIDPHLSHSKITLIFLSVVRTEPYSIASLPKENPFSVEANLYEVNPVSIFKQLPLKHMLKYVMQYMEIREDKCEIINYNATCLGQIIDSCNGLIVLEIFVLKKGGLIALNPVTRKMTVLPLGTRYPSHKESYGLAFCYSKKQFKLVHLFVDELRHTGCEILDIGTKSWRVIDGPYFGPISRFACRPVHTIGALHWIARTHRNHNEYIVSLSVEDEKFHKILLPRKNRAGDGIIEIGGQLGFVTHEEPFQIDVWVLKSLFVGQEWIKHHTIVVSQFSCVRATAMMPLYCTKIDGELVFRNKKDGSPHSYNFWSRAMRKVEMGKGLVPYNVYCIPHVNSLVSWKTHGEGEHMAD